MSMHPPARQRCQIYGETSERCINNGTHWVPWGRCSIHPTGQHGDQGACNAEYYSWECDGPCRFGEAAANVVPTRKEAA